MQRRIQHEATVQHNTILYNTIQCNIIQHNTIQCNSIQYITTQYKTMQYNTIQRNTHHNCGFANVLRFVLLFYWRYITAQLQRPYVVVFLGTAAVTVSGLMSSCKMIGKKLSDLTYLFQGAGEVSHHRPNSFHTYVIVQIHTHTYIYVRVCFILYLC